jgi:hypothetical protein
MTRRGDETMADFIISLLKRPLFYVATAMVMFGMVGIAEEIANPGYSATIGPVKGAHSEWGAIMVCAGVVLVGLYLLYRVTRNIDREEMERR